MNIVENFFKGFFLILAWNLQYRKQLKNTKFSQYLLLVKKYIAFNAKNDQFFMKIEKLLIYFNLVFIVKLYSL